MPAEKIAELYADFTVRTGDFDKGVDGAKKKTDALSQSFKQLKVASVVATGALTVFYKTAIDASIEAAETNQKFAVTFKEVSKEAEEAAKNLADNYGLARDEAKKLLSDTGDLLAGFGFTGEEALGLSEKVNQLAVDLASFSNVEGGATRASEILTKAMLGERDALVSLGIKITETQVQEELKRRGLEKATGQTLLAAKAQVTYDLALKQSGNALGDFNRSSDSTANVMRRVQARFRDIQVEVGNELTPAINDLGVTFLEASKDGGVISDALKGLARVIGVVVRSVASLIEGLSLLRSQQEQSKINEGMEKYRDNLLRARKEMKALGVSTVGQLKTLAKTDARAKAVFEFYKETTRAGRVLTDLSGRNADNLKQNADRLDELQSKIWDTNDSLDEAVDKRLKENKIVRDTVNSQNDLNKKTKQYASDLESVNTVLGFASNTVGQISQLQSMATQNELAELDNRQRAKQLAIEEDFNRERARLEATITNEEDLNEALKALDERRARDEKALSEKVAKDQRKVQRDAAKKMKALNIAQTALEIPQAAFRAYSAALVIPPPAGPLIGAANATAATALGLAKLKLIKDAPLPALAEGGLISATPGGTRAIIGEGGTDEVVAPLTPDVFAGLGAGIVDAIQNLPTPEATIIDSQSVSEPIMIHNTVNIAGETFYDMITEASANKEILINSEAIVEI